MNTTRCAAPVRTKTGILRCVVIAEHCEKHRRWQRHRIAWPMALLWQIKPWWPNKRGRHLDRARRKARR